VHFLGAFRQSFVAPPLRPRFSAMRSTIPAAAFFVAVYVVLEWVSFIHEYRGLPVTPWNPGLGVIFALMVLAGPKAAAILFVGVILAEAIVLRSNLAWPIIIGIAAIIALAYAGVAAYARTRLALDARLTTLRDVVILLCAGAAGAAISAFLLVLLLVAAGPLGWSDMAAAWIPLFIGDVIGIAVMTPLVLRSALRSHDLSPDRVRTIAPEAGLYAAVIGGSLWIILGIENVDEYQFFYVLFLPVVFAAVRHGLDGACLILAVLQLGLVGLLHGFGYDAQAFTAFQMLMLALTTTGLIVGVVVSERHNADRLARESNAKLKQKEAEAGQAARFNLVSGMASALAHEMNQPMTAARALARSAQQLIRTPAADLPRADENLTNAIAQIDHAAGIVRRMREFLRRGQPHVSTLDVADLLQDTLALARPQAGEQRVQLTASTPETLPFVHGDRIQLQQVLLNLVQNAVDAINGAGGPERHIRIAARMTGSPPHVEISVTDSGPGVRQELTDRLFEPLVTSRQEGLGLGLSICSSIVEAHGGRIWLESGRPGATEFRFSLPLSSVATHP
jgi:two-component system, LuxR family, sensor kinase FixL